MDVSKAFTYITEDEGWLGKLGIGAAVSLLSFFIVPIPLLVGYMIGITRNVMDGVEHPLPAWDDFSQLFRDGLSVMVAQLVYTLPFWVLACIGIVATVGLDGLSGANEDLAAVGIVATMGIVGCLTLIFVFALALLSPAIVIQYVKTNELAACFRFGEVVGIARANIADILIAAVATIAASFVISAASGILFIIPCIGWIAMIIISFAAGPYLTAVSGHLYGQIASKTNDKMAF